MEKQKNFMNTNLNTRSKIRKNLSTVITYIIAILIAFVYAFPIVWLIASSFSSSGSIYSFDGFFPSSYSLNSYKTLFTDTQLYNYPRWFFNTLFVAIISSIFGTISVILTAYVISTFRFKGRRTLMKGALILGMFPSFMSTTAIYMLMTQFGLTNNLWSLILISVAGAPMGYLTQKGFFDSIPRSLYESAKIDGASNFQVFKKIALPMSGPMLIYTGLTSFMYPWSDYILPKLLLKEKDKWTVAVGLMSLGETEFARFAAGSVFIAVPIIILYFILIRIMGHTRSIGAVND